MAIFVNTGRHGEFYEDYQIISQNYFDSFTQKMGQSRKAKVQLANAMKIRTKQSDDNIVMC